MSIRKAIANVLEFHTMSGDVNLGDRGSDPPALSRRTSRWRLLREEFNELEEAVHDNDLVEVADAYADIIYVCLGSAIIQIGAERFARVWDEVQRSKVKNGVRTNEAGKILKPKYWVAPEIKEIFEDDPEQFAELDVEDPECQHALETLKALGPRLDAVTSAPMRSQGVLRDMSVGELLEFASLHVFEKDLALVLKERGQDLMTRGNG